MQNIVWKILLIVVVLALCTWSLLAGDLRLGPDLQGGVSLTYKVNLAENEPDPQGVITQTITVLKERVNPKGVLAISMQPLGRDRIEVVMPLPNKEVTALADAFREAMARLLRDSEIRVGVLDDALLRNAAPTELGGDLQTERGRTITELQAAYDTRDEARAALQQAEADGVEGADLRELQLDVADAENAFDDLYDAVLGMSLGEMRIRRVLALDAESPVRQKEADGTAKVDEAGEAVFGDPLRVTAVSRLKGEYADLEGLIDATITAFDAYDQRRTGFDDPEDLMRLLRGAGVLEFRIGVEASDPQGVDPADMRRQLEEVGPENTDSAVAKWLPINELKQWYDNDAELASLELDPVGFFASGRNLVAGERDGEYYLLLYTTDDRSMTHAGDARWSIVSTGRGVDRLGRQAVNFRLNQAGANRMGRLTTSNIRKPMAIVLDGEIFSAPTIQSPISSNGQITGSFSEQELSYLIRVLAAGSLSARLSPEPIAINTLGPSLGADNLRSGRDAFIISIIAVVVFMLAYYFFAGFVADLALIANGIIIFGVMKGIDGTFTLPGLAGIVLTVGMAVDANVLIYERIREEIFGGELDLRGAVRQGYRKALSTILDANITNLIVCFVLFKTATTEVKGFALTLTIGICATLFTALFVTRQIFYIYTDVLKAKQLSMLPTVFPAIHRALEPSINWIGMRKMFWTASIIAVAGSMALVTSRGVDMFDTEFRGGVSLTMLTAPLDEDADGQPDLDEDGQVERRRLRHTGSDGVEARIRDLGRNAVDPGAGADQAARNEYQVRKEIERAVVLTVGDTEQTSDGVEASAFQVKVASPKGLDDEETITSVIVGAIVSEFGDDLDVTRPLTFAGANEQDASRYVFPIEEDELGLSIGWPDATQRIPDYLGGVAILLTDIEPAVTVEDAEKRIERMRNQPDFEKYSGRSVKVVGLTPADPDDRAAGYRDVAVLVFDEYRSYLKVDSDVWYTELAVPEWQLVTAGLQRQTSLEQVSSFSSAVAETLSAQAIVAVVLTLLGILVYIWVRFGSLRYSLAAIVALLHDVTISLGLLAVSTIVGVTAFGALFKIEPFRIDLGVVAALLTIIGYSLNDTIVILDRIRENRGKLPLATPEIVNRSINQTVSRTVLTSVTTLIAVLIMYLEGGSGIRPFTFTLLAGLMVGTYSSVAIAAPMVVRGGQAPPRTAASGDESRSKTDLELARTT